jgi:hypothetical protein
MDKGYALVGIYACIQLAFSENMRVMLCDDVKSVFSFYEGTRKYGA